MTLRGRLALGLVIIAAVLLVPLLVARTSMQHLHHHVRSLREGKFQASLVLGRLRDALGDVRAREVALGVVKSDTVHAQLVAALRRIATALERSSGAVASSAAGAAPAPSREEEFQRLRNELAKANAELERIKRRLAQPKP